MPRPEKDHLFDAKAAGIKHAETNFAGQAPQLLWWTQLGQSYFREKLADLSHAETVVYEFGSGGGRVTEYLTQLGIDPGKITGFEIDPDQVAVAQQTIPEATFMVADIAALDFFETHSNLEQEAVDLALTNMVVEWLDPGQLQQLCHNAFKSLKPGGTFVIMTTHPAKMAADSKLTEAGPYQVRLPWLNKDGVHETGPNYYREKTDFLEALQAAGFDVDNAIVEDLNLPEEARAANPAEYDRYANYPYIRLAIEVKKPV